MAELSLSVYALFVSSGWQGPHEGTVLPNHADSAEALAQQIITQYGGFRVVPEQPGRQQAAFAVEFFHRLAPDASQFVAPWLSQVGSLSAFASAADGDIDVYVNAGGQYYAFTEVDGQLYLIGRSFGVAMERLLMGFSFGLPIAPGA